MASRAGDRARPVRHLVIVARNYPGLYEYVRTRFASEQSVEVIFDRRRYADRRHAATAVEIERRLHERRTRPQVDAALRLESVQFVTIA